MEGQPTVTVSFERKASDGNYGTGTCFICWSQVPVGASKDEIEALAKTTDDVLDVVKAIALAGVKKKVDQNGA